MNTILYVTLFALVVLSSCVDALPSDATSKPAVSNHNEKTVILVKVPQSTQLSNEYKSLQVFLRGGVPQNGAEIPILSYDNMMNPFTAQAKRNSNVLSWYKDSGVMEYVTKDANVWPDFVRKSFGSNPEYYRHGFGLYSVAPGPDYWVFDAHIDCAKYSSFEYKAVKFGTYYSKNGVTHTDIWEDGPNHIAKCGAINIVDFQEKQQ
ncbi:hypothetical protein BKA69DRAFT_1089865 [Paraphysoderma sedebokerense]|nr:hypothetical protein BKA69DRAFT_1089865 [Paraphysoderma sedebokerense]